MKIVCFDVETNSNKAMCQLGMILFDTETKSTETYSENVKIVGNMGYYVREIHGLDGKDGINPNVAINDLWTWVKGADLVVAHNFSTEYNCLAHHLVKDTDLEKFLIKGVFCTLRFMRKYRPDLPGKCELLWQKLYPDKPSRGISHDALVDCYMTLDILCHCLDKYGESAIMGSVVSPIKISRMIGVYFVYREKKWRVDIANKYYGSYTTREQAETAATKKNLQLLAAAESATAALSRVVIS